MFLPRTFIGLRTSLLMRRRLGMVGILEESDPGLDISQYLKDNSKLKPLHFPGEIYKAGINSKLIEVQL